MEIISLSETVLPGTQLENLVKQFEIDYGIEFLTAASTGTFAHIDNCVVYVTYES